MAPTRDDAAVRADFETFARENWTALMTTGLAVTGSRAEATRVSVRRATD